VPTSPTDGPALGVQRLDRHTRGVRTTPPALPLRRDGRPRHPRVAAVFHDRDRGVLRDRFAAVRGGPSHSASATATSRRTSTAPPRSGRLPRPRPRRSAGPVCRSARRPGPRRRQTGPRSPAACRIPNPTPPPGSRRRFRAERPAPLPAPSASGPRWVCTCGPWSWGATFVISTPDPRRPDRAPGSRHRTAFHQQTAGGVEDRLVAVALRAEDARRGLATAARHGNSRSVRGAASGPPQPRLTPQPPTNAVTGNRPNPTPSSRPRQSRRSRGSRHSHPPTPSPATGRTRPLPAAHARAAAARGSRHSHPPTPSPATGRTRPRQSPASVAAAAGFYDEAT